MNAIEQALLWLDADRVRFWVVAWGTFGAVAWLAFFPPAATATPARQRTHAALFGLGVFLAIAAFHWPVWFFPSDLNPDEAQIVAGAITLEQFPVYWKYVDGTTHGPWCEYLLLAAHALGAPLNYFTARVVATLLQAGALLAAWGTLRPFTSERIARVGVLPALAFWAFVSWEDFVHYSTELPGIFLLALAGWLIALVLRAPHLQRRHGVLAGLAGLGLGAVPFAKLQSVPQGLALALLALLLIWFGRRDWAAGPRWQLTALFVAGGLAPALLVLGFVAAYGLWPHFHASYILSALSYLGTSEHGPGQMPLRFFHFSATEPAFACFFWGTLAFSLLYARNATTGRTLRLGVGVAWLLLAAAYASVLRPGREVVHYLHLLVIPLTLVAGWTLAAAAAETNEHQSTWRRTGPWLAFVLLALLPQVYDRAITGHRFVGLARAYHAQPISEAAHFIQTRAQPGDTVALWGWEPHLLVETGLPHGTREAQTANQLMDWPLRDYFSNRYLWDLERRQPVWFVDVVGAGSFAFQDRPNQAHEAFPKLRAFIAANYEFQAEFKNRRIYRLKTAPSAPP